MRVFPMMRGQRKNKQLQKYPCIRSLQVSGVLLLGVLILSLGACVNPFFTPRQSGDGSIPTPVVSPSGVGSGSLTPTPTPPTINLQVSGCPSLNVNWDSLIGTRAHINKVQTVICGSLTGAGSLDALVKVRYYAPSARLDFYIYSNLGGNPTRLFSVVGLLDGDAQISPTNTIITGEIGPKGLSNALQDLFKEYRWNGVSFVQVLFPGMYPDITHYQAEQSQTALNAEVAAGQNRDIWKTSADSVVNNLALHIFHWSQVTDKIITYNARTATYIIEVINSGSGGGGFIATLFRLDNNPNNVFEVSQVSSIDGSLRLITPSGGFQLTSPVRVDDSYQAGSGILGRVVLYDDTYVIIGDTGAIHGSASSGLASFTPSVTYQLNAQGMQEGMIAFYATNQNNIALSNAVIMIKVFLSA